MLVVGPHRNLIGRVLDSARDQSCLQTVGQLERVDAWTIERTDGAVVERVLEPEQLLRLSAQLIGDKLSEVSMGTVRSQPSPEGDGRDTNHPDTNTHERSLH